MSRNRKGARADASAERGSATGTEPESGPSQTRESRQTAEEPTLESRVGQVLRSATPSLRQKLAAIHNADEPLSQLILQSLPSGSRHLLCELSGVLTEEATDDGPGRLSLTPFGKEVVRAAAETTSEPGDDVFRGARIEAKRPAMQEAATGFAERFGLSLPVNTGGLETTPSAPLTSRDEVVSLLPMAANPGAELAAIGIHILPTGIVGLTTSLLGRSASLVHRGFPSGISATDVIAEVALLAKSLATSGDSVVPQEREILGIGVAMGGHVDATRGIAIRLAKYPFELDSPTLAEDIENATGLGTLIENDANAVAIYEHSVGDAADVGSAAVVLLNEGIGCGLIEHGRLVRGSAGAAGELGHVVVDAEERLCTCGNKGCLETVAGTRGIREIIAELDDGPPPSFEDALTRLQHNDKHAKIAFDRAARVLGQGLATLLNVSNPAKLILYGPPALLFDAEVASKQFLETIWETAEELTYSDKAACEFIPKRLKVETIAEAAAVTQLHHFASAD